MQKQAYTIHFDCKWSNGESINSTICHMRSTQLVGGIVVWSRIWSKWYDFRINLRMHCEMCSKEDGWMELDFGDSVCSFGKHQSKTPKRMSLLSKKGWLIAVHVLTIPLLNRKIVGTQFLATNSMFKIDTEIVATGKFKAKNLYKSPNLVYIIESSVCVPSSLCNSVNLTAENCFVAAGSFYRFSCLRNLG